MHPFLYFKYRRSFFLIFSFQKKTQKLIIKLTVLVFNISAECHFFFKLKNITGKKTLLVAYSLKVLVLLFQIAFGCFRIVKFAEESIV